MPQIMSDGKDYAKFTEIKVRKAKPGELIETFTSDGKETQNTANENDFVVTNLGGSGEEYILPADKLRELPERNFSPHTLRKKNVAQANTILQKLASIADELDTNGFSSEANCVDEVLLKLASYNAPRAGKKKKRWSVKYKKSIDCSNPKGFSQKQYCKRKRKGGDYKK
jgi:hypothetical protein